MHGVVEGADAESHPSVSTLELFFDLVFVFTITQLTSLLAAGGDGASVLQVLVLFALIWWMYDGYAWLTNSITTDRVRYRLLLIGGMAGFLVGALAVPQAYGRDGLAFGIGYLAVVGLHASMYVRGASLAEVAAILRIVPYNAAAAVLVLFGGVLGGDVQWALWALAAALVWVSPRFTSLEGFVISPGHFVERHALVVIVALGESIVVIGAGAAGVHLDLDLAVIALLSLALSASLWWLYFSDEEAIRRALEDAPPQRRPQLALTGFGYWHYGILLGVVAVAAGLKKAVGHAYEPLDLWVAVELALGAALFLTCHAGFRSTLALGGGSVGLAASGAALATAPIGSEIAAVAQVAALGAVVAAAASSVSVAAGRDRNRR